jgi:hypothetical protein
MHDIIPIPSIPWLGLGLGLIILKVTKITFRADKVKTCKKPVLAREIIL